MADTTGSADPTAAAARPVEGLGRQQLDIVRRALARVVDDPEGTAYAALADTGLAVAGKTGTAETGERSADHAWFAGYAPADAPRVAFAIALEHRGSSDRATGAHERASAGARSPGTARQPQPGGNGPSRGAIDGDRWRPTWPAGKPLYPPQSFSGKILTSAVASEGPTSRGVADSEQRRSAPRQYVEAGCRPCCLATAANFLAGRHSYMPLMLVTSHTWQAAGRPPLYIR